MKYLLTIISIIVVNQFLYGDDIYFKSGYIFKNIIVKDTIDRRINVIIDDSLRSFPLSTVYRIVKREYNPENKMNVEKFSPSSIIENDTVEIKSISENKKSDTIQRTLKSVDSLRVRINIEGGYSYRTAKVAENVPTGFKDYVEKLKSGFNIAANLGLFVWEHYGICIYFSRFTTSHSVNNILVYDQVNDKILGPGKIEDNITVLFYGIGLTQRLALREDIILIGQGIIGQADYTDEGQLIDNDIEIKGSSFAFTGLLGLDFRFFNNIVFGLNVSYLISTVDADVTKPLLAGINIKENLNRFDFNVGIRIYH